MRWRPALAGALVTACTAAHSAPDATSADGRWRVAGEGATVVVFDGGARVSSLPARSLAGRDDSALAAVHFLPRRRSFLIAFATLPELWELSVDPDAAPVYDGLVHDFRMGEALATPGFLGVRRTRLEAPLSAVLPDDGNAQVLARSADAWWLVHLDVRRVIARFAVPQGER
jgi:hypothetical protein